MILDSGNRREFATGAVRDIQEGKGRCDLMPLDVIGDIYCELDFREYGYTDKDVSNLASIFYSIDIFTKTGEREYLIGALNAFQGYAHAKSWSGTFLEVAIHFEEGAKKYGENNWKKGIPVKRYIDSAVRHLLKFVRGDDDEPHDRAFCWNIMCAIWTCKHKPELNDYAEASDLEANHDKHTTPTD